MQSRLSKHERAMGFSHREQSLSLFAPCFLLKSVFLLDRDWSIPKKVIARKRLFDPRFAHDRAKKCSGNSTEPWVCSKQSELIARKRFFARRPDRDCFARSRLLSKSESDRAFFCSKAFARKRFFARSRFARKAKK